MNSEQHTPLEEVFDEITMTEAAPSHEALMRWTKKHPEHGAALADFFATWAVQTKLPLEEPIDEGRVARRMVSDALNLLYQQDTARAAEAEKAARLSQTIKASGLTLEDVAARSNLDESVLIKLDRRHIRFWSIPNVCFERLAAAVGRAVDYVRTALDGGPVLAGANKTQGKPEAKVEEFIDAINSSDLPDEAKAEWVRIVAADPKTGGPK